MPLAQAALEAEDGHPSASAPGWRARILVVEDHEDTLEILIDLLRGEGYAVKCARSIGEALRVAGAEPFDLLLSDLGLPDGSGLDLARQLGRVHPLRGIALSGYGTERDVREAKSAGFIEHLTKPVNPQTLLRAVASALDLGQSAPAQA
jgi:two-component system CheB/CheR fusion protein